MSSCMYFSHEINLNLKSKLKRLFLPKKFTYAFSPAKYLIPKKENAFKYLDLIFWVDKSYFGHLWSKRMIPPPPPTEPFIGSSCAGACGVSPSPPLPFIGTGSSCSGASVFMIAAISSSVCWSMVVLSGSSCAGACGVIWESIQFKI